MMKKKGLSMNMLLLLAIAMIALVIILFIFSKSGETYTKSTACQNIGGRCSTATDCEGEKSFVSGCEEGQICCVEAS